MGFGAQRFQSTLPQRERNHNLICKSIKKCFNPRSRKGRDINRLKVAAAGHVSIHAPAKGATDESNTQTASGPEFQSTLPQRERRPSPAARVAPSRFNPRSREGSDDCDAVGYKAGVSIHAPAKGATLAQELLLICGKCFNPRSREGSDEDKDTMASPPQHVSIHAPAKGAT